MGFAEDWGKVYNKAAAEFQKTVNKNIPVLRNVVSDSTGLLQSLVKLDKSNPKTNKISEVAKFTKEFGKEMKTYEKERKKYANTVEAALKHFEPTKQTNAEVYRQLKLLKAELEALTARIVHNHAQYAKEETSAKLVKEQHKKEDSLRKKGATDDEVNTATFEIKAKAMLLTFATNLKAVLAQAAAAVQQAKADPTVDTYNKSIGAKGRVLSQMFVNISKMQADPEAQNSKIIKKIPNMAAYRPLLEKYGNALSQGSKQTLPQTATANEVKECISEFSGLVKDLANVAQQFAAIKV